MYNYWYIIHHVYIVLCEFPDIFIFIFLLYDAFLKHHVKINKAEVNFMKL